MKKIEDITIEQIKEIRRQLPDDWAWSKCYELSYIDVRSGKSLIKKHWALQAPDGKGCVCSLGLISHDNESDKKTFKKDEVVVFVEKSLLIIDTLLAEIDRLTASLAIPETVNKESV
jgi:hypothetical protein